MSWHNDTLQQYIVYTAVYIQYIDHLICSSYFKYSNHIRKIFSTLNLMILTVNYIFRYFGFFNVWLKNIMKFKNSAAYHLSVNALVTKIPKINELLT